MKAKCYLISKKIRMRVKKKKQKKICHL